MTNRQPCAIIKSRKQMTYNNVNKVLNNEEIPEGYEDYASTLRVMEELAVILRKVKTKRGYIDFGVDEAKILVDDGAIEFRVDEIVGKDVVCTAVNSGMLGSRKTVNVPGLVLNLPALSEKDINDIIKLNAFNTEIYESCFSDDEFDVIYI